MSISRKALPRKLRGFSRPVDFFLLRMLEHEIRRGNQSESSADCGKHY